MKRLTLKVPGKDETGKAVLEEHKLVVVISEEEYELIMRLLRMDAEMHSDSWLCLYKHAPQLSYKIGDAMNKALGAFGEWHFDEETMNESNFRQSELKPDDYCEPILVEFCGEMITDKNIIGCHYRREYLYETYPGDAGGITGRKGFDTIECDIFGCDLEYINREAFIARSKSPFYAQFESLGASLSVECLVNGKYKILTKDYTDDCDVHIVKTMQRSLQIIRKKILSRELDRIV